MRKIISLFLSIVTLLACNQGKGSFAPTYTPDPAVQALGNTLNTKLSGLLNIPYDQLVQQFTPSASATNTMNTAATDYTNLINNSNYSLTDFNNTQQQYLDSVLAQYNKQADQQQAKLDQSLAANNLIGSGPGYQQQQDFATNRAQGAGNLTAAWGENAINTQLQQQQYQDALQRGDYATLYSLGQNQANASLQPTLDAQQALSNYLSMSNGAFQTLTNADLGQYNAAMQAYNANQSNKSNLGGIGSLLGAGVGALALGPGALIPGVGPLAGALVGGSIGGGAGSLFQF